MTRRQVTQKSIKFKISLNIQNNNMRNNAPHVLRLEQIHYG